uniref:Uncharacterized protein n=1 Tax=Phage sp. ctSLR2 TaxID=2825796 RepID=A0A8S5QFY3_9VIRU|nr:MAG TPA: hypothetical protein [Phage sp. ctSLR2]
MFLENIFNQSLVFISFIGALSPYKLRFHYR